MDEDDQEELLTSPLSAVHVSSTISATPSPSTNLPPPAFAPPSLESRDQATDHMEVGDISSSLTQARSSLPPLPAARRSEPFATP